MSTLVRQPFAPLDGARLQTLTSIKNRQNASSPAASKRKASELTEDDFENVDPTNFSKRSKGTDDSFFSKDVLKAPIFTITTKPTARLAPTSPSRSLPTSPRARSVLQAKSPIGKLNTTITRSSPLAAPAGRSPTRSKRSGISSSRRRTTAGSYARIDPPRFNLGSAAPFSLDAALKGTIPGYAARSSTTSLRPVPGWSRSCCRRDTPEQEMTNLLQHGTCTLDISSDEESEQRATRERAEGRDKENIPPADDISQTSRRAAARRESEDDMLVEKERFALADLDASDYYAAGCDATSVILVPADEDETETAEKITVAIPAVDATPAAHVVEPATAALPSLPVSDEFAPEINLGSIEPVITEDVDSLMTKAEEAPCADAAVLEPMEGTGESFELWESASAKDETETETAVVAVEA
ncbi:unnamed protein product [Parascedosporium putredinis]|uniref:Thymidylate kinase n=1 Tax=Parascedosporium putredinis TaxID=1442378 RepID=A0A9P1M7K7_9PEZI|nr:unnamed protein product [Parascedosporium putredinis]CAI7990689.1 unnamed protein product [Parascedosporium putredinis]